jgi:hypothetical protein
VIIASYAVSDVDVVKGEDEFSLGLNRFNVLQSRAIAKVIVIVSDDVITDLSNDFETLEEPKLLKRDAIYSVIKVSNLSLVRPPVVQQMFKSGSREPTPEKIEIATRVGVQLGKGRFNPSVEWATPEPVW